MSKDKQFLVSVADVYMFDTTTDQLVMKGKTLISTALAQEIQNTEIFGGKGSQLQYDFNYQKMITATIEDSQVLEDYIALNNNAQIANELREYYIEETVVLDGSGSATLQETPIGNVYVEAANGTTLTIIPNGKDITVSGSEGSEVKLVYRYETIMDHITIDASKFPKAYKLVMNSDFYTKDGKSAEMQITIPQFKLNGSFSLEMTHDGVSTSTLEGKALADGNNNYAHIDIKRLNNESPTLAALAASPSEVQLSIGAGGDSEQLTVYGIRGGLYSNIIVPASELTFSSDNTSVASVTSSGLVGIASEATEGDKTTIRVTDGTVTDVVDVEIIE
ncbi:hypothetical protein [Halalkalibacter oceani]|uniref:hypothetical protein n=1 Tax=Halalkalibacter oceani TaxID=1653776 RepID=UPI00339AE3B0